MQANYYTDFVFPELYSKLPAEYSWVSLKTLDKTLWSGGHMIQAGNFKPPLFANDTVMPTQIAECAIEDSIKGKTGAKSRVDAAFGGDVCS